MNRFDHRSLTQLTPAGGMVVGWLSFLLLLGVSFVTTRFGDALPFGIGAALTILGVLSVAGMCLGFVAMCEPYNPADDHDLEADLREAYAERWSPSTTTASPRTR